MMLEVVTIGQHVLGDTPGAVKVLKLIGIEAAPFEKLETQEIRH
jgi:hypothetical protein